MKRIIASILAVMLLFSTHGILAEGLLPSFTEVAGVPIPSLGEALQCWPDSEIENEDGSVSEYYNTLDPLVLLQVSSTRNCFSR